LAENFRKISASVQPHSIGYKLGLFEYRPCTKPRLPPKEKTGVRNLPSLIFLSGELTLAVLTRADAQSQAGFAQDVALDECDPASFNVSTGAAPNFCKKLAPGASTTLSDLFAKAAARTPDPNWDLEPDNLTIKQGQVVSVVDQGAEPHTFREVKQFFPALNGPGKAPCTNAASPPVAVARIRVLQGSHLDVIGLSKGKHLFQCCIDPCMRIEVDVSKREFRHRRSLPMVGAGREHRARALAPSIYFADRRAFSRIRHGAL
jgi:hypothetical protein